MPTLTIYACSILAAYLVGAIPFGFLIGKMKGLDIRQHASGNTGATNLTRAAGRKWGILCFILDFGKGALPVLFAVMLSAEQELLILPELTAAAAVVGHVWPVYLRFKGGKGVATTLGALLILSPWAILVAALIWFVIFQSSRYVSLASMVAAVSLPIGDFLSTLWLAGRIEGVTGAGHGCGERLLTRLTCSASSSRCWVGRLAVLLSAAIAQCATGFEPRLHSV